jgi:lysophospholipase L1-like esterase
VISGLKQKLGELMFRRLWEQWRSGIADAVVPGSGGIVMLGDSITHNARWELLFPDLPMRNFGISAERSDQLLLRLEPIIQLRPSQLFLLIGTNDLARGTGVDEIAANVELLLTQLQSALPECRLHLQTLMPRAPKFAERVHNLNQRYAASAATTGVTLIDLHPLFDDGRGSLRADLSNDELHLLGSGYTIWRKALQPYLRA